MNWILLSTIISCKNLLNKIFDGIFGIKSDSLVILQSNISRQSADTHNVTKQFSRQNNTGPARFSFWWIMTYKLVKLFILAILFECSIYASSTEILDTVLPSKMKQEVSIRFPYDSSLISSMMNQQNRSNLQTTYSDGQYLKLDHVKDDLEGFLRLEDHEAAMNIFDDKAMIDGSSTSEMSLLNLSALIRFFQWSLFYSGRINYGWRN